MSAFYTAPFYYPDKEKMSKWPAIACDQYTSQKEYWEAFDAWVGDAPSSLRLILPEAYLDPATDTEREISIQETMKRYLRERIVKAMPEGVVYVRRTTQSGTRQGLVCTIDLEQYDPYGKGQIRPTEATIAERVPPRVRIRRDAALELAHIMLFCDDAQMRIADEMREVTKEEEPLYDLELFRDGGRLEGWLISGETALERVERAFSEAEKEAKTRNGKDTPFLLVGDGNHSLAAAKAHWENVKKSGASENHPARFATVEIVSIHDPAIHMEPIHRIIYGQDHETFLKRFISSAKRLGMNVKEAEEGLPMIFGEKTVYLQVEGAGERWPVHIVQQTLDEIGKEESLRIDYIHGDDTLKNLCSQYDAIGFLLPAIDKHSFFKTVELYGAMPRKTFSIGHANEKRFYMEAKKIIED